MKKLFMIFALLACSACVRFGTYTLTSTDGKKHFSTFADKAQHPSPNSAQWGQTSARLVCYFKVDMENAIDASNAAKMYCVDYYETSNPFKNCWGDWKDIGSVDKTTKEEIEKLAKPVKKPGSTTKHRVHCTDGVSYFDAEFNDFHVPTPNSGYTPEQHVAQIVCYWRSDLDKIINIVDNTNAFVDERWYKTSNPFKNSWIEVGNVANVTRLE